MIGIADNVRCHVDQAEEGGADDFCCSLRFFKEDEEGEKENDSNDEMKLSSPVGSQTSLTVQGLMFTELQNRRLSN
jgi:hypothetical protein